MKQYEKVRGKPLNYLIGGRRKGDGAKLIANSHDKLAWKTIKLCKICVEILADLYLQDTKFIRSFVD